MNLNRNEILSRFGSQHKMATWMPILMIAVLGCLLCMPHAAINSLWLDECTSVSVADHDFLKIPKALVTDSHPPLFYWILHIFLKFGRSEFVIRLPSILATIATGVLVFLIGKRVRDVEYGFMSALLYITAHWSVLMSIEARNFALATFFMVFSIWFIIRIIEAGTWKDWLGFQIMGVCSIFSFYYGALFYVVAQIILSIYVIRRGSSERTKWLCTSMLAALPVLLWLPCLHQQMSFVSTLHQEYTAYPVEKVIGGDLIVTMTDQFLHHSAWRPWYKFLINHVSWKFYHIRWIFPVFLFFLALFGQWKFRQNQHIKNEVGTVWTKILLCLAIGPVLLAFSLFVAGKFFINYRYTLILSALMAFVVVDGLLLIDKKHWRWIVFALLLAAQMTWLTSVTYEQKKEEWREAVAFVEKNSKSEDCVAIMANYTAKCYAFYARVPRSLYCIPKHWQGINRSGVRIQSLLPGTEGSNEAVSPKMLPNLINRFKQESKVVLILSHEKPWGVDMGSEVVINAILQAGLREVQRVDFTGVKVYVFNQDN